MLSEIDLKLDLRPVTPEDRDFLIGVYEASREIELAMTPWDAAQKRAFAELQFDAQVMHYKEAYPTATHDIIVSNDAAVGRLHVHRGDDQIAILDITVLPQFRKRGIATTLVSSLQAEAAETRRSVRVYVEPFNPSQKLFSDLDFLVVPHEAHNLRLEWHPEGN